MLFECLFLLHFRHKHCQVCEFFCLTKSDTAHLPHRLEQCELFRLSRPSSFVLPFWFSHCFLLNRHKNPIYTRLFLQRRVVFLCILDFKTVKTIKKSAQFQFLLQNGYKIAQVIFFFNAKEYKLFGGNVRFSAV